MSARKRSREEMEAGQSTDPAPDGLLHRLRNTWTFANVFQFLQIFGQAVGITDDYDIEDFEEDCLKTGPTRLADVAHQLAKCTRSRNDRGSLEILARKTFAERQPTENYFGDKGSDEEKDFASFDIFTKLRVIHDLSRWVWLDPENKFRARALKIEEDEEQWRINEFGWDSEERVYFVLDDNRLYRRTRAPPPPPPAAKSKAKKTKAKKAAPKPRARGTRRSARGRADTPEEEEEDDVEDVDTSEDAHMTGTEAESLDNGIGGDKWECLCITLQEYQEFIESIKKSRDADEKMLRNRLTDHVLPILEGIEEERARKVARRYKELQTLEKMATAKRSSRLAGKADKQREEQEVREAEEKRTRELAAAKKDQEKQAQLDNDRKSRMQTREQRQREREYKRILQEDELKQLEEEKKRMENGEVDAKKSERQLKAELKRKQEAIEQLEEEDEWIFDCAACGVHGQNVDDGKHSIACERCNVWQHSACLGLTEGEAEKEDFQFICDDCKRKEEDAKKPKIAPLKFKAFSSPNPSSEPPLVNGNAQSGASVAMPRPDQQQKRKAGEIDAASSKLPPMKKFKPHAITQASQPTSSTQANGTSLHNAFLNGPTLSPQGQVQDPVNGNRPPGLVSPQRPTHSLSGYSPSKPLQFGPPLHGPNSQQSVVNGSSPQKAAGLPHTPAGQKDPFRNTFASQGPGSAQSRASPHQGQTIPSQNGNRMGPPLTTPNSSFNGNGSFHAAPTTPAQHPYVPQKQPAAAPSPAPSMNLNASSPPMAPTFRADAAIAGMSPVKNSPPRPASRDVNTTPVLPPTQKLAPSPKQVEKTLTGAESPIKSTVPPPPVSMG